jgi:HTH-type transcriptional regulator/antitoxin HigA
MAARLIKTEEDYSKALARIEEIMDAKPGTAEMDELELLTALVEMYEERHFPISWPGPVDAIKFRMEQLGLKQKDLIPLLGTKSKVSEVLNGRRPLTLAMMRKVHKELGIPAEVLLKEPGGEFPETPPELDWSRFPVREMAKRGWLPMVDGVRERAEEVMLRFVESAGGLDAVPSPLLRQGLAGRLNDRADRYAVSAWCMRVSALARKTRLEAPFEQKSLIPVVLREIARLSFFENGPLLAREFLMKHGIHLIVVPHLARTCLDGGAFLLPDGNAVIGLTLRHDRLDNFWFTLLHELAHLARHLSDECRLIVDDLDPCSFGEGGLGHAENEADEVASEALVPKRYWPQLEAAEVPKAPDVLSLAAKLRVHPALIAGRIRFNRNNYRILSQLVGSGQVRRLFPEYAKETGV